MKIKIFHSHNLTFLQNAVNEFLQRYPEVYDIVVDVGSNFKIPSAVIVYDEKVRVKKKPPGRPRKKGQARFDEFGFVLLAVVIFIFILAFGFLA